MTFPDPQGRAFTTLSSCLEHGLDEIVGGTWVPALKVATAEHLAVAVTKWLATMEREFTVELAEVEPIRPTLQYLVESLREGRFDGP